MRAIAAGRSSRVCVIGGCGHVGLPLAIAFALAGHEVLVHDTNLEAIDTVRRGEMPFREAEADQLLPEALATGRLSFSAEPSSISGSEIVVLVVGTPVDEHLNPKFAAIKATLKGLLTHLWDGQLLVLRSTVFPGTSEKVQLFLQDNAKKVDVTFCPERIAEGHAFRELVTLPQIVSGFSPEGVQRASDLFRCLTEDIVELLPLEAELAKLFNNVHRYIKFSIANQFFEIANDYGLDYYRIHHAMTYKYPRSMDLAKPGFAAGPCLFKDTMQLAAFNNNNFMLGHAAMLVNEGLPNYVVQRLRARFNLRACTVGILGMAFKADSDDPRESLSYKLRKVLDIEAAEVLCSDVYIRQPGFVSAEELVRRSEVIILGAPHADYQNLDLMDKPIVDVWNFYKRGGIV
jgi:UDP-N-acetyl-D-mannosaminuronic acid dehydrogenase